MILQTCMELKLKIDMYGVGLKSKILIWYHSNFVFPNNSRETNLVPKFPTSCCIHIHLRFHLEDPKHSQSHHPELVESKYVGTIQSKTWSSDSAIPSLGVYLRIFEVQPKPR